MREQEEQIGAKARGSRRVLCSNGLWGGTTPINPSPPPPYPLVHPETGALAYTRPTPHLPAHVATTLSVSSALLTTFM